MISAPDKEFLEHFANRVAIAHHGKKPEGFISARYDNHEARVVIHINQETFDRLYTDTGCGVKVERNCDSYDQHSVFTEYDARIFALVPVGTLYRKVGSEYVEVER